VIVVEVLDWLMGRGLNCCDDPGMLDDALDRNDRYAGVALIALTLNHEDPLVVLPRIKRALRSANVQTRANALQSLGHVARLHGQIDQESLLLLVRALRDRTLVGRYRLSGYAANAAEDVGCFVTSRRSLPRWFRRRYPGGR
jgi:hypothetical protein